MVEPAINLIKRNLAGIIDKLMSSIQALIRTRSIETNAPMTLFNDFPTVFPGEAKEIAALIEKATEDFAEEVNEAKGSVPPEIIAVFQLQIKKLKRLSTYYRFIGQNKRLPGKFNFLTPSEFSYAKIAAPLREIKLKASTGVA